MTFPHLAPLCASARGDALLLLTRHADIFADRLPRDPCTRVLLPLLARAADQGIALPSFSQQSCESACQAERPSLSFIYPPCWLLAGSPMHMPQRRHARVPPVLLSSPDPGRN